MAASIPAVAGDWQFTPRLTLDETYTDNVLLSESGEEGDFVTAIVPGISVRGTGPRLVSSIDYNFQQLYYGDKSEFNGGNQQLQANTEAVLVKNWLFFEVTSRSSQQNIDNRGRISRTNRNVNPNRRDVLSYEWAPRLEHRFGSWALLTLRYFNQTVDQSGPSQGAEDALVGAGSSDEDGYSFEIASGPRFGRFPLRFTTESRKTDFQTGRRSEFNRHAGEGSYVWSRKFRFTATGGIEDNSFASRQGSRDGPFWTIGGTWTPTPRTTVSGDWGDQFFGKSFNVDANHRHRRWVFTLRYSESVRTTNEFERDLILVPLLDASGLPIFDPVTSSQIFVPIDSPTLTDDVFIQRQLNVSVNYTMRRSELSVQYFDSDREFQSAGNDEVTRGVTLNLSRSLSPRLQLSLGGTWREDESSQDGSSGTFYSFYPSLSYNLGPHTTARIRYEYTRNDGGRGAGLGGGLGGGFGGGLGGGGLPGGFDREYVENAVSANLVFHL